MRVSSFGARLIEILKIRDMSAADLSRRTGISEAVISQYKSGKYEPKQDRLEMFAQFFNVSIEWLMGYDVPVGEFNGDPQVGRVEEFINLFMQLSTDQQDMIIASMKGILSTQKTGG